VYRFRVIVLAAVVPAVLFFAVGCSPRPTSSADAVFLIVVDTLRADRLSCYGYEEHTTPHIDALAARGVRFNRARSVASWTIPSMGSMMTSLYPTQLGLTEAPAPEGKRYEWQELREQRNDTISTTEYTLAEIFRDAGYRTAAFVNQPGLIAYGNFFQGFDDAYFPGGVDKVVRYDPDTLEYPKWPPFLRSAFKTDSELITSFDAWLGENRDQQVFVWLHLLTPHWPYDPPGSYMPNEEVAETEEQQLEERFYNGEVRAIDGLVGRLTEAIERHVGIDSSVVVFTSDHGEALGERGMHDHGHTLHTEVVRLPLIVSAPSLPRGHTVDADVRSIDLLPTLLEFADVDELDLPAFEGASLIPRINGDQAVLPVYSEAMLYGGTERSLSVADFTLIYDEQEQTYALFDVSVDPREVSDISQRQPGRTAKLAAALVSIHTELVADRKLRAADASDTPTSRDERMLRALRALGYVDQAAPTGQDPEHR